MNLTIVVTGAVSSAFMPYWANWIRMQRPDIATHYLLTPSAEKFVSADAIRTVSGGDVDTDSWQGLTDPLHVTLGDWMDAMVVYPCTLNYFSRLALGVVDSPSLLAHACTDIPVVVAPSLPPGAYENEPYRMHRAALEDRDDVLIVEPTPTRSASSPRPAYGAAPMPDCIQRIDAA
ncbi:phosphopantothenoylcysteine synthetase [Rhodococcoides trifolii]|uniref:Phosphopantothenoylcysteine synthetase n=1 Tax=Rhodococcoides trifolii TaxID=908250 RepID=A0A917CW70_9NOCA|nr:flavoprotein [Rhodococcus trifolii]GGF97906.1 phosphopantothenoylcysteine synthetase [Rhodococcus trifolii]